MKEFIRGFGYAFNGIVYCLLSERNMRVHFCCLGYMIFFLTRYNFFEVTRTQWAILLVAAATVIVAEYINTAVERAVDTAAKGERSETARVAKDAAAGAVLIAALFAVATGLLILFQPEAFRLMFAYFGAHPIKIVIFAVSFALAVAFIFINPSTYLKDFRR